jgi:hypothetical protein
MHALVSGKARMAAPARTLLARAGGVWMWPGIALTERRGAASVPIAADVARFWITRLHGPEAIDSAVLRCLAIAAQKMSDGHEAGAQQALDASGLTRVSSDGEVLMRAVAGSLGIGPLDLPWADGPRLWRAEDIAAHVPLFKEHAAAAGLLAKAGAWDEAKHPRAPAGSREGGQFQRAGVVAALRKSRQKFRQWTRVPNRSAMPLQSLPRGGWRVRWRALLLDLRESLSSRWTRRWKPPYGFTINILLSKPTLTGQSRSKSFKNNVGKPGKGYDVHHIVEQTPARDNRIPDALIDGPDNLVLIPRLKHWEITGWYMHGNERYGGRSPREYLRGEDWDERRRVGLDALIRFGVLKP